MNFSRHPRSPPSSSLARLASTSFIFILLWVPEPVCQIAGELLRVLSGQHFVSGGDDRPGFLRRQQSEIRLTFAAARLVSARAYISSPGIFFGRDAEMLQRALGLGAPEFIGRDLDGAHRVFSLRCVVITFSLDEKCVIATKLTCLKD